MSGTYIGVKKGGTPLLSVGVPVLFLFYFFTPNRPIQFITLFIILLILVSKVYSEYLIRHLRIVRLDKDLRVFRYEWVAVELWVENHGLLPAFLLVLEDASGGIAVFQDIKRLCSLGGKSRQLFHWDAYGSSRGVFFPGPASLRGADPLGLFPFTLIFNEAAETAEAAKLFVYPAPAYSGLKTPGGIPLGNLITPDPFNEDLTRPRSLREYSPGDESRRINWKASAKISGMANPLLVNEYEASLSYPLVLFLNVDPEEYAIKKREQYIERVIEVGAAVCLMAARERQVLGLIIHTGTSNASDGDPENTAMLGDIISPASFTLIPILERLATLKPFGNKTADSQNEPAVDENWEQTDALLKKLRPSTERLLERGKALSFGTRLIYAGPNPAVEDFLALETLKKRRLSLEFLIIDERNLGSEGGKGNSFRESRGKIPKYQIKEMGYEIV